jgi:hypothetical protein
MSGIGHRYRLTGLYISRKVVQSIYMWQHLYGWTAIWLVVPLLIGIGIGVLSMSPPEPRIAQACFTVALGILLTKLSWWLIAERNEPMWQRAMFIAVIFGASGALWFAGWMLADSRLQQ